MTQILTASKSSPTRGAVWASLGLLLSFVTVPLTGLTWPIGHQHLFDLIPLGPPLGTVIHPLYLSLIGFIGLLLGGLAFLQATRHSRAQQNDGYKLTLPLSIVSFILAILWLYELVLYIF
jgi:hypothetical protein